MFGCCFQFCLPLISSATSATIRHTVEGTVLALSLSTGKAQHTHKNAYIVYIIVCVCGCRELMASALLNRFKSKQASPATRHASSLPVHWNVTDCTLV
ncbi:hypothetical protein O181_041286 [Austropuccinia psidii MF-1]|uniref:Uncharacterized protein n=1 Tax=Austropuccinia psidii MF-1 TaxID=1389203 RepID=A0A9Q3DCU0_9BASI|nr:hypothetical protein [Austropuccinia psidii MF-1]